MPFTKCQKFLVVIFSNNFLQFLSSFFLRLQLHICKVFLYFFWYFRVSVYVLFVFISISQYISLDNFFKCMFKLASLFFPHLQQVIKPNAFFFCYKHFIFQLNFQLTTIIFHLVSLGFQSFHFYDYIFLYVLQQVLIDDLSLLLLSVNSKI